MTLRWNKLSALAVNSARTPSYYGDGGGLWLQVSPSGTKSWVFRFTLAGRRREMGLGTVRTIALASARVKVRACRQLLLDGRDPIEARRTDRIATALSQARQLTFDQCAAAYIDAHRHGWKNPKRVSQWENTIATYASPVIGALPVADVDTDLIVKILSPIWASKTETAARLRGRIESILDWATVSKFRQGENPARWRGHLDQLLATPHKIAPVRNHPALPWHKMATFMAALNAREGIAARAVQFAILTACRSGEVRGATWSEIDLEENLWTIPAARMKAGKEHRVPLSDAAKALLAAMERDGDNFAFPG